MASSFIGVMEPVPWKRAEEKCWGGERTDFVHSHFEDWPRPRRAFPMLFWQRLASAPFFVHRLNDWETARQYACYFSSSHDCGLPTRSISTITVSYDQTRRETSTIPLIQRRTGRYVSFSICRAPYPVF